MRDQGRCIFGLGACVWQCLFQQAVSFVVGWWFFHCYGFWIKNYSLCKMAVLLSFHLSMGAGVGHCCFQKMVGLCHSLCPTSWQSSALEPCCPSTVARNAGVNCVSWAFRCSAARMWGGRERGEENHLCDNFLRISDFSKINCELPECFPLPTL